MYSYTYKCHRHVFSLKGKDGKAILPVFCDSILGRDSKSVCFSDDLDCILSVQYSIRPYSTLICYLDIVRKTTKNKTTSVVVQIPLHIAGKKDEPDWTETAYLFFEFYDGIVQLSRVLTESDMRARKKKHFTVKCGCVQIVAYNGMYEHYPIAAANSGP